jgi:hypothetical protein
MLAHKSMFLAPNDKNNVAIWQQFAGNRFDASRRICIAPHTGERSGGLCVRAGACGGVMWKLGVVVVFGLGLGLSGCAQTQSYGDRAAAECQARGFGSGQEYWACVNRVANDRRNEDAAARAEFARRWDATANAMMLMGGAMVATSQQMEASQPKPAASSSSVFYPGLGGNWCTGAMGTAWYRC